MAVEDGGEVTGLFVGLVAGFFLGQFLYCLVDFEMVGWWFRKAICRHEKKYYLTLPGWYCLKCGASRDK
jgi:hypothetical protein